MSVSEHAPRYQVGDRKPFRLLDLMLAWESVLVVLLIMVVVVNAWISPYFLDVFNLSDATVNFSEKAIVALAMALLILVGDIDLSVAAIIALASLAMGLASVAGVSTPGLVLIGLGVGAVAGAFNGLLVTGIGLPSIVVTIGTMSLYRGIAQVVLGDQAITRYPAGLQALGQGTLFEMPPLPWSFAIFLGLALVIGLVLHRTTIGRRLYAIGNNAIAARYSGIRVERIRFWLFVLSGLAGGLAAVLLTGRIGSTRPNIALGWELEIITMVVLGGVSISGGSGSIPGVVLAVFVLGFTTFGMSLVNVPGIVINVLLGVLLIAAIAAPLIVRRLVKGNR
ncbi:ABC transporter permease [Bradyrhizobium sp. HKCCYLS20291]|uniref:ABC transporter permease n=1 Tax=Bradyrhizobium sp. HKCCYLS20291 TaxID=3420766 RepID=UPI003EC10E66